MNRFKLIFNILFTLIGWLSSAVTLWVFYAGVTTSGPFWTAACIVLVIAILYVVLQIHTYQQEHRGVSVHSTEEKVHKYLYDWIKGSGCTVIFTRDFTWADCNPNMLSMLRKKAKKHELIICLHKSTEITDELQKAGAEVYTHNLHDLKSRFTIIHYGTHSPQITVGSRNERGDFVNERYTQQSNPNAYNVFVELFESTKATSIAQNPS